MEKATARRPSLGICGAWGCGRFLLIRNIFKTVTRHARAGLENSLPVCHSLETPILLQDTTSAARWSLCPGPNHRRKLAAILAYRHHRAAIIQSERQKKIGCFNQNMRNLKDKLPPRLIYASFKYENRHFKRHHHHHNASSRGEKTPTPPPPLTDSYSVPIRAPSNCCVVLACPCAPECLYFITDWYNVRCTCCCTPACQHPTAEWARCRRISCGQSADLPSLGGRTELRTGWPAHRQEWDTTPWPTLAPLQTAPCPSGLGGEALTRTCSGAHEQGGGQRSELQRQETKSIKALTCGVFAEVPLPWFCIWTLWKQLTEVREAGISPNHWKTYRPKT